MVLDAFIWYQTKCLKTENTDNHTINGVLLYFNTLSVEMVGLPPFFR